MEVVVAKKNTCLLFHKDLWGSCESNDRSSGTRDLQNSYVSGQKCIAIIVSCNQIWSTFVGRGPTATNHQGDLPARI